jgi:AAHS family 4-hydroxybenzoate transporter-like MFS transporter
MIPQFGWRSVLVLGGVAPLLLLLGLLRLPESARYMVHKAFPAERIRRTLMRISPDAAAAGRFELVEPGPVTRAHTGAGVVLSPPYLVGTLMLWLAYFMGLVIFYALINWMPILFKDAGLPAQQATLISALFPLGGVGAVALGWLMDRWDADALIGIGYVLTALAVYAIGQAAGQVGALVVVVFIAGTLMNTAQSSMPSLAAAFYPTKGRATGVSWMLGIGRFGGIAGSFLVAELARQKMGIEGIFLIVAVPGAVAALALFVKRALNPNARLPHGPRVPALGH